jgi:hypothetical protein
MPPGEGWQSDFVRLAKRRKLAKASLRESERRG